MKRYLLVILPLLFIYACTENKSVTEKLDLDEVSELVEQDSLYEKLILEADVKRKLIEVNIVLMSKFKDLSFGDYYNYKITFQDTNLTKKISQNAQERFAKEVDSLLVIYKPKIDSQMTEYKTKYKEIDPSNYFKVEFVSISKEYYSYSHDVKNVNVNFRIIPLRGTIQGGLFHYDVIPKVTEKSVASAGCRFSSTTSKPSVYTWEAPYDVEKEFKYSSTNEVKNKYDFKFLISTVRYNGDTFKSLDLFDIPVEFQIFIDKDTLSIDNYYFILQSYYKIENVSMSYLYHDLLKKEKVRLNKIAYEFENIPLLKTE